jgi:hypothetical protein
LRDIPGVDKACTSRDAQPQQAFDHRRRQNPKGKEILEALVKRCDVLVGEFRSRRA